MPNLTWKAQSFSFLYEGCLLTRVSILYFDPNYGSHLPPSIFQLLKLHVEENFQFSDDEDMNWGMDAAVITIECHGDNQ